jgi:hypothetical protein
LVLNGGSKKEAGYNRVMNKQLNDLYALACVIKNSDMYGACGTYGGEGPRLVGRPRCRWEDIKMHRLKGGGLHSMSRARDKWLAVVNMVMNISSPRTTLVYGVR